MNNDDLNRLANELLTAFFDKADANVLVEIADRYHIPITGKIFKKATDRATEWLESGNSHVYDLLTETNKSHMFQMSLQSISDKYGAVLGKDFSIANGGMMIDNQLLDRMMADLPPEALVEFKKAGHIKLVTQDPFKMLEDSLEVPFFTSLEAVVKLRLKTLDDIQMASYLSFLATGMQNKLDWLSDVWILGFFRKTVSSDRFANFMKTDSVEDCDVAALVLDDLLTALGKTSRTEIEDFGIAVRREDLLALDKVFN